MRCSHCGFENQPGQYRCQKCGNFLLPPLPREIYTQPPPAIHHRAERRMRKLAFSSLCLLLGMGIGMIAMLVVISVKAFMGTTEVSEVMAEEIEENSVSLDLDSFFEFEPSENSLRLPDSDVVIGLPAYTSVSSTADMDNKKVIHELSLENGLVMNIACFQMDYPFSKSAEEDYFMEMYDYDALIGQEDQYFILERTERGAKATVIDRINKNNYEITIEGAGLIEASSVKEALELMRNVVIGQSSLVPEEI